MNFKYIITALLIAPITVFAQKEIVKFSGKIKGQNIDSVLIFSNVNIVKILKVDRNGTFSDTLNVETGLYAMSAGTEMTTIFLKNGFDVKVSFDTKQFDETIHYEGKGGNENNFVAKQILIDEQLNQSIEGLTDEKKFDALITTRTQKEIDILEKGSFDPDFKRIEKEYLMHHAMGTKAQFAKEMAINKLKNSQSPLFSYESMSGKIVKLEDLKGKYVFIDIWATWCKPCIAEIPYLKEMERRYEGKNIAFVSLSVDYQKNKDKWRQFVKEKNLAGIQLLADKDFKSQFMMDYAVSSIPRFILIDPKGKVVEADAKRPSSTELATQLDALLN